MQKFLLQKYSFSEPNINFWDTKFLRVFSFFSPVAAHAAAYLDITPIPGGVSGSGNTTRTWDCCKPSCSWLDNLNSTSATTPVRSCLIDGETTADIDAESGCVNGTAFACTDQQPRVYNDTISLGFVGASFTG